MTWRDIDAVVIGTAPDMFEGVMMPELYLADALGAAGKPIMRVHTAGSVGGSTAVVASHLVHLAASASACSRSRSRSSPRATRSGASSRRPQRRRGRGRLLRAAHARLHRALGRARLRRAGMVAVKDRLNALEEPVCPPAAPRHHHRDGAESPMVWEPIRRLESCPTSDGACAHGAHRRGGRRRAPPSRRRGCTAPPCAASSASSRGATR